MSHTNCNLPVHMSCLISLRIPYFIFGLYIQHYEPLKLKLAFLFDSCCLFISFISSNLAYLVRFTFTNLSCCIHRIYSNTLHFLFSVVQGPSFLIQEGRAHEWHASSKQ
jgi:hypothetical protein